MALLILTLTKSQKWPLYDPDPFTYLVLCDTLIFYLTCNVLLQNGHFSKVVLDNYLLLVKFVFKGTHAVYKKIEIIPGIKE